MICAAPASASATVASVARARSSSVGSESEEGRGIAVTLPAPAAHFSLPHGCEPRKLTRHRVPNPQRACYLVPAAEVAALDHGGLMIQPAHPTYLPNQFDLFSKRVHVQYSTTS